MKKIPLEDEAPLKAKNIYLISPKRSTFNKGLFLAKTIGLEVKKGCFYMIANMLKFVGELSRYLLA